MGLVGSLVRMSTPQTSGDRVEALTEDVGTQTRVRITTSYHSEFADLVTALEQVDEVDEIAILTDSETVTELRKLFFTTTRLVDHMQADKVEIRTQESHLPSLTITEDSIQTTTGFPDADPSVVETTEESCIEDTIETFDERFEEAEEVTFRQPGYFAMLDTLEQKFDASLVEDFEKALREAKESERPSLEIDPVFVTVLVGAYNEISFYQLSWWGEDIRLASRAKFSRKKQKLQEEDLVAVEKIPRPVGRPRQRLLLGKAVAEEESLEEIVATAIQDLSRGS